MRRIIFIYLCSFNIINYLLTLFGGTDTEGFDAGFHPGIVIKGILTVILLLYFIFNLSKDSFYFKVITPLLLLLLFIHPIVTYNDYSLSGFIFELNQSFKIILFIMTIYYVYNNKEYFLSKLNIIVTINIVVVSLNLYLAYFFSFGREWTLAYQGLDYYKGFLGGNALSVYLFIFFAYLLYNFKVNSLNKFLFFINIGNFYILGTKSIYFTILISILFVFQNIKTNKKNAFLFLFATMLFVFIFEYTAIGEKAESLYQDRVGFHYETQYQKLKDRGLIYSNPLLSVIEKITTGPRLYNAIKIINETFKSDSWNLLFGHGANTFIKNELYSKMDPPDILYKYGIIGFLSIYGIIILSIKRTFFSSNYEFLNVIIISIAIYSSLGGFVIAAGDVAILFGFFLGLNYNPKNKS